ncbi:LCP family protein [Caldicellulosiruptoraceae bacterium PP1]
MMKEKIKNLFSNRKKVLIISIISVFIICAITLLFLYKTYFIDAKNINKVFNLNYKKVSAKKTNNVVYPFDNNSINFLIIGLDKGSNRSKYDLYRTDTILFANINLKDKKVRCISIPRDTLTEIYNVGKWDKINSAFGYGGGLNDKGFFYSMETVSKLLGGMPIQYYVCFELDAIRKIVNILGGVYVNVEIPVKVKTQWVDVDLKPGYQKLNGIETLYYALWRKTPGGDIDRIKRDKELILSVFEQLQKSNQIIKLPEIYWKIRRHFYTNLNFQQISSLAMFAKNIKKENILMESVPGDYYNYYGASYWKVDYEKLKQLIKQLYSYDVEIDLQLPDKYKYNYYNSNKYRINNKNNVNNNNRNNNVTKPDSLKEKQDNENNKVIPKENSIDNQVYNNNDQNETLNNTQQNNSTENNTQNNTINNTDNKNNTNLNDKKNNLNDSSSTQNNYINENNNLTTSQETYDIR